MKLVEKVVTDMKKIAGGEKTPAGKVTVEMTSENPLGSGMGSSAAWGASLACALLHAAHFLLTGQTFDNSREKEFVWSYTNFLEALYHGRPSGCDAAVSIHGGVLFYQRGTPPAKTIVRPLPRCKLDSLGMLVVNTNQKKDTKRLVAQVGAFKQANPEEFRELVNTLGDVTSELVECLQEQTLDPFAFLDYISMNQQYLQDLGVSAPAIDDIVSAMMLREVHGKLTGAGGGGCVIGFPKDPRSADLEGLRTDLTAKGYTVLDNISVGHSGYSVRFN